MTEKNVIPDRRTNNIITYVLVASELVRTSIWVGLEKMSVISLVFHEDNILVCDGMLGRLEDCV